MKIIGVIAAKENSNRFKGKNYYMYHGEPIFYHNVKAMIEAGIENIYVATDSKFIKEYCEAKGVNVIWRCDNINHDEQPVFDVLKYVHMTQDKYDIMFTILANTIHVKPEDIARMLEVMNKNNLRRFVVMTQVVLKMAAWL